MVTTVQILGGSRSLRGLCGTTIFRVYSEGWYDEQNYVTEVSPQVDYITARADYLDAIDAMPQGSVGPNGEPPKQTYVALYLETAKGNKFVAAKGIPSEQTPDEVQAKGAPELPPETEPTEASLSPGSKSLFWQHNKWYVIGGAAALGLAGGVAAVYAKTHRKK